MGMAVGGYVGDSLRTIKYITDGHYCECNSCVGLGSFAFIYTAK
jgi:hypothetical protein